MLPPLPEGEKKTHPILVRGSFQTPEALASACVAKAPRLPAKQFGYIRIIFGHECDPHIEKWDETKAVPLSGVKRETFHEFVVRHTQKFFTKGA